MTRCCTKVKEPGNPRAEAQTKRRQGYINGIQGQQVRRGGGGEEEDWEKHRDEFETGTPEYQLKSKDMVYYLRMTLKDQKLPVHRSEYPRKVKTQPKICRIL